MVQYLKALHVQYLWKIALASLYSIHILMSPGRDFASVITNMVDKNKLSRKQRECWVGHEAESLN